MGRAGRLGIIASVLGLLVFAPAAAAQEYATETGDLDLEVSVAITVTISGDGYVEDSVVFVTLTGGDGGGEIDLGTLATDAQGRFFGGVTLPEGLEPGTYTITATGVTSRGATRVLSALVGVGQEVALAPPSAEVTATTVLERTVTTSRPDRGDGLDPIVEATTTLPTAPDDDDPDRTVAMLILGGSAVGLSGLWLWLYRIAKR